MSRQGAESVTVKLADLIVDSALQNRAGGEDAKQVWNIREAIAARKPIDRLKVFVCTTEGKEGLYLYGGFTRFQAYKAEGKVQAPALRRKGTWEELVLLAAKENTDKLHLSMPLFPGDRRRAAQMVLKVHPDWSDGKVAGELGFARSTVQAARAEMGDEAKPKKRTGHDGRTRELPPERPKPEPSLDVAASWRQVPLQEFLKNDSGDFWRMLDYEDIDTAGQLWDALTDPEDKRLVKLTPQVRLNLKGQLEELHGGDDAELPPPKPPKTGTPTDWDWKRDYEAWAGQLYVRLKDQLPRVRPDVRNMMEYKGIVRRLNELAEDVKLLKKRLES